MEYLRRICCCDCGPTKTGYKQETSPLVKFNLIEMEGVDIAACGTSGPKLLSDFSIHQVDIAYDRSQGFRLVENQGQQAHPLIKGASGDDFQIYSLPYGIDGETCVITVKIPNHTHESVTSHSCSEVSLSGYS